MQRDIAWFDECAQALGQRNKLPVYLARVHKQNLESLVKVTGKDLEALSAQAPLAENKIRIDEVHNNMIYQLRQVLNQARNELKSMTPRQQAEAITFWRGFKSFFTYIVECLKTAFEKLLDTIGKPYDYLNAVANLIAPLQSWVNFIFPAVPFSL